MINYGNDKGMDIDCENCGSSDMFDGSFKDCIEQAKDNGWIFVKDGKDWMHFCDKECRDEYMNEED